MENFQPEHVCFLGFKAWKGISKPDVVIGTMMGEQSACEGYPFEVGATYLVVTDNDGSMQVDLVCGLTHRMNLVNKEKSDADIINALGHPDKIFAQP